MTFAKRLFEYCLVASLLALTCISAVQSRELPDFTGMVERYGPAVVNISTSQHRSQAGKGHGFSIPDLPEGSPFNDFFQRFFDELPLDQYRDGTPRDFESRSLGSGFIISDDGYILTNHHVVSEADEVIVRLNDRREFTAEVVGSDKRSDTAVLKIDADHLPTVKIGKATDLKVGEWVLAIGSPFGFDHSVTAGIVSAKGRSLPSENYVPFIQTDVAINPGNSGGPLFNLDGEVVGVNAQIYSETGAYMGLSFAIPIETAMNVADQLRTKGKVSRGWLGVLIQDVTRELAESFDMDHPRGALVSQVLPDSPAEDAGMKTGDIILTFNGKEVARSAQLPPIVGASPIDKPAKVGILRDGRHKTITIRLGELPDEEPSLGHNSTRDGGNTGGALGLDVADLTSKQRKDWELEQGVLVRSIQPGPASDAGIREGDVILKLNNQDVRNVDAFEEIVEGLPEGKSVAVLVEREAGPLFLALKVPEE
jgi:serine protease Do